MKQTIILFAIIALAVAGLLSRSSNASYARDQAMQLSAAPASPETTLKLNALKTYVSSHSGATVTVVMTSAYQQALQAYQAATTPTPPSTTLYAEAQAACAGRAVATVQAQCNQQFIESHSVATTAPNVPMPAARDYSYRLIAPAFALDGPTGFWTLSFLGLIWLLLPALRPRAYL